MLARFPLLRLLQGGREAAAVVPDLCLGLIGLLTLLAVLLVIRAFRGDRP